MPAPGRGPLPVALGCAATDRQGEATLGEYTRGPADSRRLRGESAVTEAAEFKIGTRASCTDGSCGEVRRLIVNPATYTVTHLVIGPRHRKDEDRLVPVQLADTKGGEIWLHCTLAEFDKLDHAEERDLVEGMEGVGTGGSLGTGLVAGVGGETYGMVAGQEISVGAGSLRPRTVVQDVVPVGETEVSPGDHVHAVDGEIGQVHGFIVDPDDHGVTHLLLREGHLWGRKEVAIPISAVTAVDDGIRLNITKEQIGNLPPAD